MLSTKQLDLSLQQVNSQFLMDTSSALDSSPTVTCCPSTIVNWPREPSPIAGVYTGDGTAIQQDILLLQVVT